MSVSSAASGTQTATINTEHVLTTQTAVGVYVFVVDAANMVADDILELRIYTKNQSGGTSRVAYYATFANILAEPNLYSVPVPIDTEIKVTLKQTAGTGRDFPWNLLKM